MESLLVAGTKNDSSGCPSRTYSSPSGKRACDRCAGRDALLQLRLQFDGDPAEAVGEMTYVTAILLDDVERLSVALEAQLDDGGQQGNRDQEASQHDEKQSGECRAHGVVRKRSVLSQWNFAPVIGASTWETKARETEKMLTPNPRTRNGRRQMRLRV